MTDPLTSSLLRERADVLERLRRFDRSLPGPSRISLLHKEDEITRILAQEHKSRLEAEQASSRFQFLANASVELMGHLDTSQVLERLSQLVIPSFADYCIIDLLAKDGGFHTVTAHADPEKESVLADLRATFGLDKNLTDPTWRVLKSRKPRLFADVTTRMLASASPDPVLLDLLKELNPHSYMIVPIQARGKIWGALHLARTAPNRRYNDNDLNLAVELAMRAAIAVENAKLLEDTRNSVSKRDEFLSVASHELKTPIQSHRLQVQLIRRILQNEKMSPTLQQIEKLMAMSEHAIARLCKLVDNLLDVSRITSSHRMSLERQTMDLSELVQEIIHRNALTETGSSVPEIRLSCVRPVIGYWDRLRLDQVITNLLTNAIKYGEGKPIEIRLKLEGRKAHLSVLDQGMGIDKEHQARIFERFQRATREHQSASLGLGLFIVRSIILAHDGRVWVESQPGQGAAFHIELPLQADSR